MQSFLSLEVEVEYVEEYFDDNNQLLVHTAISYFRLTPVSQSRIEYYSLDESLHWFYLAVDDAIINKNSPEKHKTVLLEFAKNIGAPSIDLDVCPYIGIDGNLDITVIVEYLEGTLKKNHYY